MPSPCESAAATRLADGQVLIDGGNDCSWNLATAELYDLATGTIKLTGSMTIVRNNATATQLADGRVPITGSDNGSGGDFRNPGNYLASAELGDPTTGTFSATG